MIRNGFSSCVSCFLIQLSVVHFFRVFDFRRRISLNSKKGPTQPFRPSQQWDASYSDQQHCWFFRIRNVSGKNAQQLWYACKTLEKPCWATTQLLISKLYSIFYAQIYSWSDQLFLQTLHSTFLLRDVTEWSTRKLDLTQRVVRQHQ